MGSNGGMFFFSAMPYSCEQWMLTLNRALQITRYISYYRSWNSCTDNELRDHFQTLMRQVSRQDQRATQCNQQYEEERGRRIGIKKRSAYSTEYIKNLENIFQFPERSCGFRISSPRSAHWANLVTYRWTEFYYELPTPFMQNTLTKSQPILSYIQPPDYSL